MAVKPFQVKMEPQAHARLKMRASQVGATIGEMIENLLASFELRLKRLYDEIDPEGSADSLYVDNSLIRLLFQHDQGELSEADFKRKLQGIAKAARDTRWHPKIKLGRSVDLNRFQESLKEVSEGKNK